MRNYAITKSLFDMVGQKKSSKKSDDDEEWVVEKVVGKRINNKGEVEYRLNWEGWLKPTWEPESHLNCPKLIAEFEERETAKNTAKSEKKQIVGRKSRDAGKSAISVRNETRTKVKRTSSDHRSSGKSASKAESTVTSGKRNVRHTSDSGDCENHRLESETKREESSSAYKKRKSSELITLMRSPWDRGLEPEEIQGANHEDGLLKFLMKWKNSAEPQMVLASEANLRCPQIVIDFYEKNLAWQPPSRKK